MTRSITAELPDQLVRMCAARWPHESWSTIIATALRRQLATAGPPPPPQQPVRRRLRDEIDRDEHGQRVAVRTVVLEGPDGTPCDVQQFESPVGEPITEWTDVAHLSDPDVEESER